MLKKLSLKFTAYAVAALFIAELVMLALINGLNVYGQLSKSLEAIETIHENKGRLPMLRLVLSMGHPFSPPSGGFFSEKGPSGP